MLEFYRGDTFQKHFTVSWNLPITGIYFTVKQTSDDKNPLIRKKLNDGIVLVDKADDGDIYLLTIDAEDTENMKTGNYSYDFEFISNKFKLTPPESVGTITLKEDITRKRDEY